MYDEYKHKHEIYDELRLLLVRSILTLNESNSGNSFSKENIL